MSTIDPKATHQIAEYKHGVPLTSLGVDPKGRFAAAGGEDLEIQVWDLSSGKKHTLKGHKSWVRSFDFTPDGSRLVSACWGGEIGIWNLTRANHPDRQTIKAHQGAARFVRVSPDGKRLATCGNDLLVKVWNLDDGELLHEFKGHDRHVYGADFHPGGNHVVSQDLMGKIKIWDLQADKLDREINADVMTGYDNKFAADMGGARDMGFHPSGSEWASAGITNVVNSFAGIQDPIIVVFDWKTGKIKTKITSADKNVKGIAWGVKYHPEGFLIGAIADRSGKGYLWFIKPGQEKPFFEMKLNSAARGLGLFPDGKRLAIAHADGALRIYEMTAKQ